MRIVVSDSSCLIDLRKVSLLEAFLQLPYEVLIPNTLFEDELLKFTAAQKKMLVRGGLQVVDLPGEQVTRVVEVKREAPRLSTNDAFAFVLAEGHPDCILLTGDGLLRTLAEDHEMEVHGVLWVIDELHDHKIETASKLHRALRTMEDDPTFRLPSRALQAAIRRYSKK